MAEFAAQIDAIANRLPDPTVNVPRLEEPARFRAGYCAQYALLVGPSFAVSGVFESEKKEDVVGNVMAISDVLDNGNHRDFAYGALNRFTSATSSTKLWGNSSGNSHTYDTISNMTVDRFCTFSFARRSGFARLSLTSQTLIGPLRRPSRLFLAL